MNDMQEIKGRPIYEYNTNDLINAIFENEKNKDYKTDFLEQLDVKLNKQIEDFELVIKKASDKLLSRKKRFNQLANACNSLYYNLFFNEEDTSYKDIYLTRDWKNESYFNAIVCVDFLQYQKTKIEESEQKTNTEITRPLTRKQTIVLLEFLKEKEVFKPNKIHQDATKQALLIAVLMGIEIKGEVKNSDIYDFWKDVSKTKYEDEYFTLENLNKIEKFIKDTDLYVDFQEYKTKAQTKAEIKRVHRGVNKERI
jgi:hypothetical protein